MLEIQISIEHDVIYIKVGPENGVQLEKSELQSLLKLTSTEKRVFLQNILNRYSDKRISKVEKDRLLRIVASNRFVEIELVDLLVNNKAFKIIKNDESYKLICNTNDGSECGDLYETLNDLMRELPKEYGYTKDEVQEIIDTIKGILN